MKKRHRTRKNKRNYVVSSDSTSDSDSPHNNQKSSCSENVSTDKPLTSTAIDKSNDYLERLYKHFYDSD